MWIETFIQQPTPQEQTKASKKASYFLWWFTLVMILIMWFSSIPRTNAEAEDMYNIHQQIMALSWEIAQLQNDYDLKDAQCSAELLDIHTKADAKRVELNTLIEEFEKKTGLKMQSQLQ